MSLKKKKAKEKSQTTTTQVHSHPAYKCFECHSNTFVTTQLVYGN